MVSVPISFGELFDKITILRIKSELIRNPEKLLNIKTELAALSSAAKECVPDTPDVSDLVETLYTINRRLWDIEDGKRDAERRKVFDADFIELARQVYIQNDQRADIKRQINLALGSAIIEEKSYGQY
ncbi:DUF6165 family protein [Flavimaricola sp.]|jgi:hypothetical protein|nr:DUF6165 family protein [Flavimaricola sp.]MDA9019877.1 DUF6165 family protein [Flavimaricola sp.]